MDQNERASAATLKLYAQRDMLNLYELACLAHGVDPECIALNVHAEQSKHWREVHGADVGPLPLEVAELISVLPEIILGSEVGGTLKALCTATGGTLQRFVPIAQARRLLGALALVLPHELGHVESPAERQERRLKRFRELGGEMREAGDGWHRNGRLGALADLAREEAAAGRPKSDRSDVRRELLAAMKAHRGS